MREKEEAFEEVPGGVGFDGKQREGEEDVCWGGGDAGGGDVCGDEGGGAKYVLFGAEIPTIKVSVCVWFAPPPRHQNVAIYKTLALAI